MMKSCEEKRNWLAKELGKDYYYEFTEPKTINHYYKAIHDFNMGLTDADDYAWLITLFGYDIGAENAFEIIRWYYENFDATVNDMVGINQKIELWYVCNKLNIHLDFSMWTDAEPKCYVFY